MNRMGRLTAGVLACTLALGAAETPREIRAIEEAAARNARLTEAERQKMKDQALRAVAEFELMPPRIMTKVPEKYQKWNLDYAMNCGTAVTPGGRVWATWVAGEDGFKSHVVGAWSDDGGRTWTETKFVVDSHFPGDRFGFATVVRNHQVANLWCLDDGKLRLTVFQSMNNWIGRGGTWEFVCANPDAAEPVWSEPRYLFPGSVHNKPLKTRDGTWFYFNDYEPMGREFFPELEPFMGCGVYATKTGEALERRGFTRPEGTWHWAEHAGVQRPDGSLWMLLRTGKGLMESFSADQGETWTKPAPTTRMRTCVARFVFRRLASGNLLFVKNGDQVDVAPSRREKMCAYLSEDEGATWKGPLMLDERNGVSYPDAFQFPDGSVGLTYDHGRGTAAEILFARFTEADVRAGRLVSPQSYLKQVVTAPKGIVNVPVESVRPVLRDRSRYSGWSTLTRLRNGELVVAYSGDREGHVCPYGKVQLVRSGDAGATWSDPVTVCDGPLDERDAAVLELANGDLLLFWFTSLAFVEYENYYKAHPEYLEIGRKIPDDVRRAELGSWCRRSTDGGRTWGEKVRVPVMTPHGGVQLRDGRVLVVGMENAQALGQLKTDPGAKKGSDCAVAESTDGGRTFHLLARIDKSGLRNPGHWSLGEPQLVEAPDGALHAYFRYEVDARDGGWSNQKVYPRTMCHAVSRDGGKSWTKLERKGPDGFPPHFCRLDGKRVLLTYGSRTPGRIGVYAVLSRDGGATFDFKHEICIYRSACEDSGYPTTASLGDGRFLTVFYTFPEKNRPATLMAATWRLDGTSGRGTDKKE